MDSIFLEKQLGDERMFEVQFYVLKKRIRTPIDILGGTRLNFNMGFRFTTDLHARFHGMVDDDFKNRVMSSSCGLGLSCKVE